MSSGYLPLNDRVKSGELFHVDSIQHADSLEYSTILGRTVYGGGGITPDVFIPLDTVGNSRDLAELVWSGTLRDGAFNWVDTHRSSLDGLNGFKDLYESDVWNDPVNGGLAEMMSEYNEMMGVWPNWEEEEALIIEKRFLSQVARNLFGEEEFYRSTTQEDEHVERAIYELLEGQWFSLREGRLYLSFNKTDL